MTFNAYYIDWFDLSKQYKHVIRVKNWREKVAEMNETGPLFATGYAADSVTNPYAREWGTTVFIFRDARIDINARVAKEIAEERW